MFEWEKWNGKGYDKKSNFLYELKKCKNYIKEYKMNNHLIFEGENINTKGKVFYNYKGLIFEG